MNLRHFRAANGVFSRRFGFLFRFFHSGPFPPFRAFRWFVFQIRSEIGLISLKAGAPTVFFLSFSVPSWPYVRMFEAFPDIRLPNSSAIKRRTPSPLFLCVSYSGWVAVNREDFSGMARTPSPPLNFLSDSVSLQILLLRELTPRDRLESFRNSSDPSPATRRSSACALYEFFFFPRVQTLRRPCVGFVCYSHIFRV